MDRSVPAAFALLGILVGVVDQLRSALPTVLSDPSIRSFRVWILVVGAVLFAVLTLGVAALGYWANRRVALPGEYAQFGLVAGVAGCLGFLVGSIAVIATASVPFADGLLFVAVGVGYSALTKAVSIGLLGLAGAAIAHFREVATREKSGA